MDFSEFTCLSFDCYGTLIDWEKGLSCALRPILESHGVAVDNDALLESYGAAEAEVEAGEFRPYRAVLKAVLLRLGGGYGFTPSPDELEAFSDSVSAWPAFPDSSAALRALSGRYRLIILSNVDDDFFRGSQETLGVAFDRVFTAGQIGSYKPSRRNFEHLLRHAGAARGEILHVAQSLYHDILPARALGLSTVWVNRRLGLKGSGATPPAAATADVEVPDLASLARLTGSMR